MTSKNTFKILVKTAFGLENVLAKELKDLGLQEIEVLKRAVYCVGNTEDLYKINYLSRTALRVYKFIKEVDVFNEDGLYGEISKIQWDSLFEVNQCFAIDSIVNSTRFTHSKYVALKAKDAIVDQFRSKYNKRPSIDTYDPDLRILIHIRDTTCGVFLDSSGYSLHKRGYRIMNTEAPISECLAAGMLLLAGWSSEKKVFYDPMCGSGTFLIEASMIALNIPAGKFRSYYAFEKWNDYDEKLFYQVKSEALSKVCKPSAELKIIGNDKSRRVLQSAKENIRKAALLDLIELNAKPFEKLKNNDPEGLMVTNPPYDKRIVDEDIEGLYKAFGDLLKNEFCGWSAWIISSNFAALKKVGLSTSRKLVLYNGADECKFQRYDMYTGSKKKKKNT